MRVLIADDDPVIHEELSGRVASRGHEVSVCHSGDEAWEGFVSKKPPIVILDWNMEHGGTPLCRKIREHERGPETVVIAITNGSAELEEVLDGGADDYVTKPVDPKQFEVRLAIAEQREKEIQRRLEVEAELKRVNDGLSKANAELQEANEKLKSNQSQLVHSEKMASIGQLAAGIAHEINNPVGFVKSNLGMLSDYVGVFKNLLGEYSTLAEDVRKGPVNGQAEALERIDKILQDENLDFVMEDVDSLLSESLNGADRVREIAQSLKSFARLDEAEMQYADLNEGLEVTLRMISNEIKYHCTVHKDLQPLPPILCYPGQLNQVFMNLIINASQAINDEGEIAIETRALEDEVLVRIADTGEGIPQKNIPKLFNPFFTTKPIGEGTGLGLSVSYGIIKRHNGRIEVESELGTGTTFSIYLPTAGKPNE